MHIAKKTNTPGAALTALALLLATPTHAGVTTGIDAEADLPYWQFAQDDISVRLVQRLPDQTRGFFQARGFSAADAERVAQSCVFQTIFKNRPHPKGGGNSGVLDYDLKEWTVHAGGKKSKMKTREDWQKEWTARGVPQAAQLAFEWSLIPTRQRYGAGDYNWGFSIFNLAPGTRFDLDLVWRENGARRSGRINGIICAPDVEVPPAAQ